GATINPSTGAFSWTPSEDQGPGPFTFTVRVTDNGTPQLYAEQTVTINTVAAGIVNGNLLVVGTSGIDSAIVDYTDSPTVKVTVNGTLYTFAGASAVPVIVNLYGGNDTLTGNATSAADAFA